MKHIPPERQLPVAELGSPWVRVSASAGSNSLLLFSAGLLAAVLRSPAAVAQPWQAQKCCAPDSCSVPTNLFWQAAAAAPDSALRAVWDQKAVVLNPQAERVSITPRCARAAEGVQVRAPPRPDLSSCTPAVLCSLQPCFHQLYFQPVLSCPAARWGSNA